MSHSIKAARKSCARCTSKLNDYPMEQLGATPTEYEQLKASKVIGRMCPECTARALTAQRAENEFAAKSPEEKERLTRREYARHFADLVRYAKSCRAKHIESLVADFTKDPLSAASWMAGHIQEIARTSVTTEFVATIERVMNLSLSQSIDEANVNNRIDDVAFRNNVRACLKGLVTRMSESLLNFNVELSYSSMFSNATAVSAARAKADWLKYDAKEFESIINKLAGSKID